VRGRECLKVRHIRNKERGLTMKELEQFLNVEGEWIMDKMRNCKVGDIDYAYYQGRLDQLAQVRRYLGYPQIMTERASA
jgi:hypothetical protein